MSANVDIFINAQEDATGVIRSVIGSMDDLERGSGNLLTRGLEPLQNMLATGLKVAAGAATAAIGGLVTGITKSVIAAGDMEQGIADISASMGASAEETEKLKTMIGDLGLDPKLKVTATQAAEAIGQLGTAGLSVDQILNGAARSTVLLANATGADFGQAANMATDVMALWGIKAEDLTSAVNGITSTTIASKFTIQDYALALAQGGGVAATVGVGFEDFNATIARIAPYFSSGADAGTSFKVFLQRLVPQSDKAQDTMRGLGLMTIDVNKAAEDLSKKLGYKIVPSLEAVRTAAEEYTYQLGLGEAGSAKLAKETQKLLNQYERNSFFTASGQMKDMAEISGILNEATKDLSEEAKNEAYSIMFGTDAMRAAAAIAGTTTEEFLALKETMAKTDAEEAAAKRMDTFKGSIEILGGVFETLSLLIGDQFLPTLTDLTKRFTEFLQSVGPRVVEWAGVLAKNLEALINYVILVVQEGDTMNDWLTNMHPALRGIVESTIQFVAWLRTTITAISDFIAPIIEVVKQYVGWKDIMNVLGAVITSMVVPALLSIAAALAPLIASITASVAISRALRTAWEMDFGGIRTMVGDALNYLGERFGILLTAIKMFGGGALAEIIAWANGNKTQFMNLATIWDVAKATLTKFFEDILRTVQTAIPVWINKFGELTAATWQWIANATGPTLIKLGEWATGVFNWITGNIPTWIAKFAPMGIALFKWIGDSIPKAIDELTRWVDGLLMWGNTTGTSKTQEMLNKLGAAMLQALGKIGISLGNLALTVAGDILIYFAKGLLDWAGIDVSVRTLHGHLISLLDGIKTLLGEKAGLVGGAIVLALIPGFTSIAGAIAGTLIPAFGSLVAWLGGTLFSAITGFVSSIMGGAGIFTALSSLGTLITGTIIPAIVAFAAPFAPVLAVIAAVAAAAVGLYLAWQHNFLGIRDITYSALEGIKNLFAGLPGMLSSLGSTLYESGRNLVGSISTGVNSAASAIHDAGRYVVTRLGEGFAAARDFAAGQIQQVMNDVQQHGVGFAAGAFAGRLYEAARTAILEFGRGFLSAAPNVVGDMNNFMNNLSNSINGAMGGIRNSIYAVATSIGTSLSEGLRAVDPSGAIGTAITGMINTFNGMMGSFNTHVRAVATGLATAMGESFRGINLGAVINDAVTGMINTFNGAMGGFINHARSVAIALGTSMSEGLRSISMGNILGGMVDAMIVNFNTVMDGFKNHARASATDLGVRIGDGLRAVNPGQIMASALQGIIDQFNYMMGAIKNHVFSVMREAGVRIGDGLTEGIKSTVQGVLDALSWITSMAPQWVKDKLGIRSPSRVFEEIGNNIMAGLAQGIEQLAMQPQAAMGMATDGLTTAAQATSNSIINRNDQRSYQFVLPPASEPNQDQIETVRSLTALYGGVR